LDFDHNDGIPSCVLIWVKLPCLPLSYWGDDCLEEIRNSLGKYLDKSKLKGRHIAYANICVEVDQEKGLPQEINLTQYGWTHCQKLDY
jgi:hypothetical protein